jgi:hypothetical protein
MKINKPKIKTPCNLLINPKNLRIIIPTRNSAGWIGVFNQKYQDYGIKPLYILDARSTDMTISILKDINADYVTYSPSKNYPEDGMIEYGSIVAATDWIFRLDDDEFPSKALIYWLYLLQQSDSINGIKISRRDVSLINNSYVYSRWPSRINFEGYHNPMPRLFRANSVSYINKVHTPGFNFDDATFIYAPNNCFFIHVNNILRSTKERLEKVRIYASYDKETSWSLVDECLPEFTDPLIHNYASDALDEFLPLLNTLPRNLDIELPVISIDEKKFMDEGLKKQIEKHNLHMYYSKLDKNAAQSIFIYFPAKITRLIAEMFLTTSKQLSKFGEHLFRVIKLKDRVNNNK